MGNEEIVGDLGVPGCGFKQLEVESAEDGRQSQVDLCRGEVDAHALARAPAEGDEVFLALLRAWNQPAVRVEFRGVGEFVRVAVLDQRGHGHGCPGRDHPVFVGDRVVGRYPFQPPDHPVREPVAFLHHCVEIRKRFQLRQRWDRVRVGDGGLQLGFEFRIDFGIGDDVVCCRFEEERRCLLPGCDHGLALVDKSWDRLFFRGQVAVEKFVEDGST